MRLFNIILFLMLTSSSVNGQNNPIKSTELDSLYVRALNSRIDLLLSSGWKYIELNEYGNRIKSLNVSDRYKFLTNDELIDLSIKKKKTISVIKVLHKIVAKDTIDINFGLVNVTAKRKIHFNNGLKFKKAEFTIGCGGTNGYQPDIRFVFNERKKSWDISSNRYVVTSKSEINNKSINLYAFIGKKISVTEFNPNENNERKIVDSITGDTLIRKSYIMDNGFKAKYKIVRNVFNDIKTDTIEFLAYDHYGRPGFENYDNVILYISFNKEKEHYYHQKYQFDPVEKTRNGTWKGLKGESIEQLFIDKKKGVFTARGLFDE
ncbi:hypothetical protein [Aquimarina macrocephali]|uniref:hypothetical protein n=1 Tax=Aquimarina macrocephali TaxID=666563 RepID=UPI003F681B78